MEINREQVLVLQIDSDADVGICRRKSVSLAGVLGFDDVKMGEIAILVSELVTNVLKHGGGKGRIVICYLKTEDKKKAIEFFCFDAGAGIQNLEYAMSDGLSGKNTLGLGLGTIHRFSDTFEIGSMISMPLDEVDSKINSEYKHCIRVVKWVPESHWLGSNKSIGIGV